MTVTLINDTDRPAFESAVKQEAKRRPLIEGARQAMVVVLDEAEFGLLGTTEVKSCPSCGSSQRVERMPT